MAVISIYAHKATFQTIGGYRSMSYMLLGGTDEVLERKVIETTKTAEIVAEMEAMRDRHKGKGQSFFVGAALRRGDRAPNGFKQLQRIQHDHEDEPAEALAPRPDDQRKALELAAEARLKGAKAQKAPGSDGGLFDDNSARQMALV